MRDTDEQVKIHLKSIQTPTDTTRRKHLRDPSIIID